MPPDLGEKEFKCPLCGKPIDYVHINVTAEQCMSIDENGVGFEWDCIEEIGSMDKASCPECMCDITEHISEG